MTDRTHEALPPVYQEVDNLIDKLIADRDALAAALRKIASGRIRGINCAAIAKAALKHGEGL